VAIAAAVALFVRQPGHPRLREWIERVRELAEPSPEGNL